MHCMLLLQCCVTGTHARMHTHTYVHTYLTDSRCEALGILECLQQGRDEGRSGHCMCDPGLQHHGVLTGSTPATCPVVCVPSQVSLNHTQSFKTTFQINQVSQLSGGPKLTSIMYIQTALGPGTCMMQANEP